MEQDVDQIQLVVMERDRERDVELGLVVMDQLDMVLDLVNRGNHRQRFQYYEMVRHPLDVHGRTELHLAAMEGHEHIVRRIMNSPNLSIHVVNATDNFGLTPLHLAVRSQRVNIVRILTKSGWLLPDRFIAASGVLDEWGLECEGFTPLHMASRTGNIAIVKQLLRQMPGSTCQGGVGYEPVNIHATTWQHKSPLDIAKKQKHKDLVDLLECFDVNRLQSELERTANSQNAILVGTVLVATLAFGCLLQPPLGIPDASGPANAIPHLTAQGRSENEADFFVLVAFSLAFSLVALVTGTLAIMPSRGASLRREVHHLRKSVYWTAILLFLAILFLALAAHIANVLVFKSVVFENGWISTVGEKIVRWVSFLCLVCMLVLVILSRRVFGLKVRTTMGVAVASLVAFGIIYAVKSGHGLHD